MTAQPGEDLTHLIKPLARVQRPYGACPMCRKHEHLDVYETHVEWACGHTHPLPSLPNQRAAPGRKAVGR